MGSSVLFEPAKIGKLEIKNRFIRAATAEGLADEGGRPPAVLAGVYRNLAQAEVGLIVTGHAFVHTMGRHNLRQTGIHQDENISSLRRLCRAVAGTDSKIFVQLSHAGRQSRPGVLPGQPWAPSAVPFGNGMYNPRAMTEGEIEEVIWAFGQAARRAREAGFYGIEIHAAHGFLISSFLSPHTNRRTDKWGGSEENRLRFLLEVYKRVRQEVGREFPVKMKLNASDYLKNGLKPEDGAAIASRMVSEGIDAITVSGGMHEQDDSPRPKTRDIKSPQEEAYFRSEARVIKNAVGKLPVALVGGLRTPRIMEQIVQERIAEFVALSRPFIMEPDLVKRIKAGKRDPAACDSCNDCLGAGSLSCPKLP
ncbi:MAG: NADH:flavin oxidoreductase [Thermodesulfobacteriota bacterium]